MDHRIVELDSFFCDSCRIYVYDEAKGDQYQGIAPRTQVDYLPESWQCPVCGADKHQLRAVTLFDHYLADEEIEAETMVVEEKTTVFDPTTVAGKANEPIKHQS
ncbi:MAG: rubredoxin [Cyanobacteria bacterium]|nr:rubredoxin [Cyanobacteriota bacterium]